MAITSIVIGMFLGHWLGWHLMTKAYEANYKEFYKKDKFE